MDKIETASKINAVLEELRTGDGSGRVVTLAYLEEALAAKSLTLVDLVDRLGLSHIVPEMPTNYIWSAVVADLANRGDNLKLQIEIPLLPPTIET